MAISFKFVAEARSKISLHPKPYPKGYLRIPFKDLLFGCSVLFRGPLGDKVEEEGLREHSLV